jgi:hypothetical protein
MAHNYWYPSFRLIDKEKGADGCTRKSMKRARRRPASAAGVFGGIEESKAELRRRKNGYNPVELNGRLNGAVGCLLDINREKDKVKQAFREGD